MEGISRTYQKFTLSLDPDITPVTNRKRRIRSGGSRLARRLPRLPQPDQSAHLLFPSIMELISQVWDLISHINEYLEGWVQKYPVAVYGILFAIIFAETGLVITPFLPGDSLLFAVGAVAARPEMGLNVWLVSLVILVAAIIGDSVNYWIGRNLSQWMMRKFPRLVKQSHIDKTNVFFEKYGGKTLIIARFVPIVRTFAPFVAGSGRMDYGKFMYFNVVGAILWVVIIIPAGYFFGQLEVVKNNFELVVIGIIVVSLIPGIVGFIQARTANRRALAGAEVAASGE